MSEAAPDSPPSPRRELRCRQPGVTRDGLNEAIALYKTRLRELPPYGPHLRWWIARYSRGDELTSLRAALATVVDQVDRDGAAAQSESGGVAAIFRYGPGYIDFYRDALVLLSIARCVRLPDAASRVLRWCERGDALIELLAEANDQTRSEQRADPPFPEVFDGLYAALAAAEPVDASEALRRYLAVWLDGRMYDMGFKIADEGIGYWCFEAAGVVAALCLDDSSFAGDPVYPTDLVAFARERDG